MSDTKQELQLANALLKEHIVNQQSTIDRLTEQLKEQIESGYGLCKRISNPMAVCNCKYCVSDRSRALIAEIEAGK